MKNTGEAKVISGIGISLDRWTQKLCIDQSEYMRNVLERFCMTKSQQLRIYHISKYLRETTNPPKTCHTVKQSEALCTLWSLVCPILHFLVWSYRTTTKILLHTIGSQWNVFFTTLMELATSASFTTDLKHCVSACNRMRTVVYVE